MHTERSVTVYGLCSSADGKIRYVGQTVRTMEQRFSRHMTSARTGVKTHLYNWMRSELADGHQVNAFEIERNAILGDTERRLIAMYRRLGARLVNGTDGGDGALGWTPSDEQRQRMSLAGRGRKVPAEVIAKRIATMKAKGGRRMSPELIAKLSAANTGKKLSPETIAKRTATRAANGGYEQSDEQRMRRSAAVTAWWATRKGVQNVAP